MGELPPSHLFVAKTEHTGDGLFTRRAFARHDTVFVMQGELRFFASRSLEDSHRFENWVGIGRVVFGLAERDMKALTAAHVENPTLDLPCTTVFEAGQRPTEVVGPLLADEAAQLHVDFWKDK